MNPRKPTNLKIIQGTFRKDRATKGEPQPEITIPEVPAHLSDEAKVEWGRISQELYRLGLMTKLDRAALAAYCQNYARWVKAEREIAKAEEYGGGEVHKAPSGYLVQSAWLPIAHKALELMHKYMRGFGMDPESRTKISASPQNKEDEFEGFVRSRKTKA